MLRYSLLILFYLYVPLSQSETEVINPDQAMEELRSNQMLKQQISEATGRAQNANSPNLDLENIDLKKSDLGTTAIEKLLERANKQSEIGSSSSRGAVTEEQHITGIADEQMAKTRHKTLESMGIDPTISGFIFVSESMPESLIRAYSRDATRLGMSLVFYGFVDNGSVKNKFLELSEKYHSKRNAMTVQTDTRLFDAFEIERVPAIVITDLASLDICNESGPTNAFVYQQKEYSFQKCNPAPSSRYCKLSGSVFTDWAIQKMAKEDCSIAQNFLAKTRENPATEQNTIDASLWERYVQSFQPDEQEWTEYEKEVFKMMQGDFK